MFTGIVERMGTVAAVTSTGAYTMTFSDAAPILSDCHLGDSIAINGTCLTVTAFTADTFTVGLAPETLARTNLGDLVAGGRVNMERAVSAADHAASEGGATRLGGHVVQGHVDCTGRVLKRTPEGDSVRIRISVPSEYIAYCVEKGYICLDGTSLTLTAVSRDECWVEIVMIEYTQRHVVLGVKSIGERVNIEVDVLGKYIVGMISATLEAQVTATKSSEANSADRSGMEEWVRQLVRDEVAKVLSARKE